ncbi:MAG: RDD family protein [Actinomycetota bacterium]|nr:RDD family protein [Actinomycetota bacterium]
MRVASPSRRLASAQLDAAIVIGACIGARRLRRRAVLDSSLRAQAEDLVVAGCYFAGVPALAGRTPGQAVLGLRVVESDTHGAPGWRPLLVRWLVLQLPHVLVVAVSGLPSVRTALAALQEVQPEADELRRHYGRDRRSLNDALLGLYRSRAVDPWASGWPILAAAVVGWAYEVVMIAGVLRPPRRQGVHDRLANVLVVDERGR